ncbi:MAG: hypothetical protein HPY85_04885 [Anaerolineae bacterium]|nr:hypothetical protein [Anaerolineae bacterium]
MILKKLVRLIGWLIAATSGIFLLYELYNLAMRSSIVVLFAGPNIVQTLVILFFAIGLVLSTQNQILGGVITTLTPLIYMVILSIAAGRIVTPIFILLMLIGGIFLLFTAEQE